MQIVRYPEFEKELDAILDYIALDSLERAIQFQRELQQRISAIVNMPYAHRRSIHFHDEHVRDLIFKGYTITYLIDGDTIVILGILKYKKNFLFKS